MIAAGERRPGVPVRPASLMGRLPVQFFAALTQRAAALASSGVDVINLGQGNPDLPTPPHIVEALRAAVLDPATHRYPPFRGLPELKVAICQYYASAYGVTLDPEREVAILFGGKSGLVELSQTLLDPGDVALVPDPGYPDYLSGIALAGAEAVTLPLLEERGFLPDLTSVDPDVARRAKLLFLNYPNNPTASVATKDFFADVVTFAERHGVIVAHDFAYGAIGFGERPPSFLQTPGARSVGVEVCTLSKTYNMAGWRVGFALGHADVIEQLNLLQDHCFVSIFGAVQKAACIALSGSQDSVEDLRRTYERRKNSFLAELGARGIRTLVPGGSFFVWLPTPEGVGSLDYAERIMQTAHVVVAPGVGFGEAGEGYVRVGMLADETRLREAAQRIAAASRS